MLSVRTSLVALLAGAGLIACTLPALRGAPAQIGRTSATPIQSKDAYYQRGAADIDARIRERGLKSRAKNVILFVGDGMGIATITSARIYAGQKRGVDGESFTLAMDTLPYSALSKTYSHNFQVPDSAATATAMTAGLKNNSGMLGTTSEAAYGNCPSSIGKGTDTLFELAERAGLATGLISTARITHATPAAAYAESAKRDWESDADMKGEPGSCKDIARQLIEWPDGDGFDLVLGGGRSAFLRADQADPEETGKSGARKDGRDLTAEWTKKSPDHVYITDRKGFDAIDWKSGKKVLGLFERSHMQFESDRAADKGGEPSLAELTRAAITRLSQDEDGFVLMVEAGRIDHAHHGVNAARALEDTDALDLAVKAALDMTNDQDTLIIVTADHSHTLSMAGYPMRGNPILGKVVGGPGGEGDGALDGKPYTTLSYANGASACRLEGTVQVCTRQDLSNIDTTAKDFRQPSLVPMMAETHGGEDVAIFASGPGAHLFSGVMEQHTIFHVMGRSSGLVKGP
jgi:alkaline phosphatase